MALLLPLAVGACGGKVAQQADSDPQPGVMRAHALPVQGIGVANTKAGSIGNTSENQGSASRILSDRGRGPSGLRLS